MFLGIDLGTSSIKLLLVKENNFVLAESSISLEISRPFELWSEQNPDDWWKALLKGIEEIKSKIPLKNLIDLGCTCLKLYANKTLLHVMFSIYLNLF